MEISGRLFDLYPAGASMVLWIKGDGGRLHRFEDPFRPRFCARGEKSDLSGLFQALEKMKWAAGRQWTRKKEFWSGQEIDVMEIEIKDADAYAQLPRFLPSWEEKIAFYNCDVSLSQVYLYAKALFPTGRCFAETDGDWLLNIRPDPSESVWIDDGEFLDLRVMEMSSPGSNGNGRSLLLECEGCRIEMDRLDPAEIKAFFKRFDPDVVLSKEGDASLLPLIFSAEKKAAVSIPWDRESRPAKREARAKGFSYFSYGRTYYKAPPHHFLGRWHIDRKNSFIHAESGLDGVIELARLAKIPVQRMARSSPGTAITSMQLDRAFQENILVPWRKGEPERFKTAWDLLVADKGGLVFQPRLGIFEDVAEIDFASMYPTMMAIHNISPETMFCSCCDNRAVPESGYTICEKREGIVPKTLRPILKRRAWLKKMAKEGDPEKREAYGRKQTALKWMLVTSFGYLGYRNARFGRIEAHEAVTAFGRESLLRAKEICEEAGFELLHALTDALWVRKKGFTEEEILKLCEKIGEATGAVMSLEGIYRWLAFLPSKGNPESPVANRYFGLFRSGKIKARGLAFRRGDMPPLVQEAQVRMLDSLAATKDLNGYRARIPGILDLLLEYSLKLKSGRAKNEDLAVRKRISQEPNDYKVDSLTALAAQQLEDSGIAVHPGEQVRYMIKDAESKDKDARVRPFPLVGPDDNYDVKKYLGLLYKAAEEMLIHFGYNAKSLKKKMEEER